MKLKCRFLSMLLAFGLMSMGYGMDVAEANARYFEGLVKVEVNGVQQEAAFGIDLHTGAAALKYEGNFLELNGLCEDKGKARFEVKFFEGQINPIYIADKVDWISQGVFGNYVLLDTVTGEAYNISFEKSFFRNSYYLNRVYLNRPYYWTSDKSEVGRFKIEMIDFEDAYRKKMHKYVAIFDTKTGALFLIIRQWINGAISANSVHDIHKIRYAIDEAGPVGRFELKRFEDQERAFGILDTQTQKLYKARHHPNWASWGYAIVSGAWTGAASSLYFAWEEQGQESK